jgi:hypothetical protein
LKELIEVVNEISDDNELITGKPTLINAAATVDAIAGLYK